MIPLRDMGLVSCVLLVVLSRVGAGGQGGGIGDAVAGDGQVPSLPSLCLPTEPCCRVTPLHMHRAGAEQGLQHNPVMGTEALSGPEPRGVCEYKQGWHPQRQPKLCAL